MRRDSKVDFDDSKMAAAAGEALHATQGGAKQPPPLKLDGNVLANWNGWKRDFEIFRYATGLDERSGKRNVNMMLHCMGKDCVQIYDSFDFSNGPDDPEERRKGEELDLVIASFDEYFGQKKRLRQIRLEFNRLKQQDGDTVLTFVNRLRQKARECDYGDSADERVLDRLCDGLSVKITERLCEADYGETELTLDKAIEICKTMEMTEEHLREAETKSVRVHAARVDNTTDTRGRTRSRSRGNFARSSYHPRFEMNPRPATDRRFSRYTRNVSSFNPEDDNDFQSYVNSSVGYKWKCDYCGRSHPHGRDNCPAYGTECGFCRKLHHWARCCRAGRQGMMMRQDFGAARPAYCRGNRTRRSYANVQRGVHVVETHSDSEW